MEYNETLPLMKLEYKQEIMFTHAGQLNHMSLQRQYEKAQTRHTYPTWLKSIQNPNLMARHNLDLKDLAEFNMIHKGPITTFFNLEWETFYEQIKRTFDTWFFDQGWNLQLPTTI
jgi:hypothetical protein